MTVPPEVAAEVKAWVREAENDLRNAEFVLEMPENCPTDTVCFHCQQCAEKYLKAVLTLHASQFSRTHDLVVLLNLLRDATEIALDAEQVQPLNRYSVEARYPGDWEPIEKREAASAVEMARRVREAVRAQLPGELLI
jgi:HEPN domain-containing protein